MLACFRDVVKMVKNLKSVFSVPCGNVPVHRALDTIECIHGEHVSDKTLRICGMNLNLRNKTHFAS